MARHKFPITRGMTVKIAFDEKALTVDVPESPKSAHKAGEPFTGGVLSVEEKYLPSGGLEYADEIRPAEPNEWFVSASGNAIFNHTRSLWHDPREILRPRAIRRNAEPVKDKPELPRIKVETWNKNAERSEYYFSGNVDWKRLVKETFGEGAEVVKVTLLEGTWRHIKDGHIVKGGTILILFAWQVTLGAWAWDKYWCWYYMSDNCVTDAAIVAAIREHNKPAKPQYKVGEVVKLKGDGGLPDGEYKILESRHAMKDEMIINNEDIGIAKIISLDIDYRDVFVIAPMPSTGYYDFTVEGVKCRAYEDDKKHLIYVTKDVIHPSRLLNAAIVSIFSTVDARLKAERGYGIIPVPYAVSNGHFEAPEA